MVSKLGLQTKIPLMIVGCAVASGLSIATFGYWAASARMADLSAQQLTLLARDRADALGSDLKAIADDLRVTAAAPSMVEAVERLGEAYKAIPGDPAAALQKAYVTDNPNPPDQRQKLDAGVTGTSYDALHATYHPWLRTLRTVNGYADVLLFDAEGNVVYTAAKAADFGGRLEPGKGSATTADLTALFQAVQKGSAGSVTFQDFKPYNPDKGAASGFMATRIVAGGRSVGVLAYRLSVDRLNAILGAPSLAGETAETLLVGADGVIRNDSRFTTETDSLSTPLQNAAVTEALSQRIGVTRTGDYRGVALDQVAVPFEFGGSRFAVVAAVEAAESDAAISRLRTLFLVFTGLAVTVAGVLGLWLTRSITTRIAKIVLAFNNLAEGKLDKPELGENSGDELGDLARSFAVCRQTFEQGRVLEAGDKATRAMESKRQAHLQEAVDQFRTNVANVISSVEAEIEGIRSASGVLTQVADGAAGEANSAREASTSSAENVDAIATTVEQLSTSIREIAERAQRASDHVVLAGDIARKADKDVAGLADSAEKVGAIVDLIKDIAGQTNLLALNATIEAARAGEAGRGFAVVASEVKQLASQTSKATEDISRQIMSIQSATRDAVTSIRTIASTVSEIEALAGSIAAAVQEQDAATGEIFNSVATAADRSKLLARNVDGLTSAVSETNREAQQVMMVSYQLSAVASVLSSDVEDFINKVAVDVKERRLSHRYGSSHVSVALPGGRTTSTRCIDISETGARIADVQGLDVDSALELVMPDGVRLACKVMWIENGMIGVKFDEPIGNAVFDYAVDPAAAAA